MISNLEPPTHTLSLPTKKLAIVGRWVDVIPTMTTAAVMKITCATFQLSGFQMGMRRGVFYAPFLSALYVCNTSSVCPFVLFEKNRVL